MPHHPSKPQPPSNCRLDALARADRHWEGPPLLSPVGPAGRFPAPATEPWLPRGVAHWDLVEWHCVNQALSHPAAKWRGVAFDAAPAPGWSPTAKWVQSGCKHGKAGSPSQASSWYRHQWENQRMSLPSKRSSVIGHWKPWRFTSRQREVNAACCTFLGEWHDTTRAPAISDTVLADKEEVLVLLPDPACCRARECHAKHTKTSPWQRTLWGQSQTKRCPCNSCSDCKRWGWSAIHWAYLITWAAPAQSRPT